MARPSVCPVYGLLDSVRSAWNVGSMFRSADAAGLAGLYLCGITATPPRADLEKTALGAQRCVPWDYWPRTDAALDSLRSRGIALVALECAPAARPFDADDYRFPVCFVVGHEVDGVAPSIVERCDRAAAIPMHGLKRSLNVAVSFGLMAYALRRCWEAQAAPSSRCE